MNTTYSTLFIGKIIHHFNTLPSTNTYAIEYLAKNNPSEGTVISTFNQTQGKGQFDSKWESEEGQNLTQTIILYPKFILPRQQFLLSKMVALATRDFIASLLPDTVETHIKWPNDILVEGKKIAGILIQNSLSGAKISHSIVGIGININQTDFQFIGGRKPTSLAVENGEYYHLPTLQQQLFWHLEYRYLQLKNHQWMPLHQDYLTNLYQYRKMQTFEKPDGTRFRGFIEGVTEEGYLIVNWDGHRNEFALKEVKFV